MPKKCPAREKEALGPAIGTSGHVCLYLELNSIEFSMLTKAVSFPLLESSLPLTEDPIVSTPEPTTSQDNARLP